VKPGDFRFGSKWSYAALGAGSHRLRAEGGMSSGGGFQNKSLWREARPTDALPAAAL